MSVDVLVVGSVNTDMIVRVPVLPTPGQTVTGGILKQQGGGKGANQAVAAARLGARVAMVASVGADAAADEAIRELNGEGVAEARVTMQLDAPTGVALIVVDDLGENQIAVASGANERLDAVTVTALLEDIELSPGGVCLLGFEVPDNAIEVAARWGADRKAHVILNPAPARVLSATLAEYTTILTPNAVEAVEMTGARSPEEAADVLVRETGCSVVVTMGERGVVVASGERLERSAAHESDVVDTTGAGDAFNAALAVALSEQKSFAEAVNRAQAAAAISTRGLGARAGLPTAHELEVFLRHHAQRSDSVD